MAKVNEMSEKKKKHERIENDTGWMSYGEGKDYDDHNLQTHFPEGEIKWVRFWDSVTIDEYLTQRKVVHMFDVRLEDEDPPVVPDQYYSKPTWDLINKAGELVADAAEIITRAHGSDGPERDDPDYEAWVCCQALGNALDNFMELA